MKLTNTTLLTRLLTGFGAILALSCLLGVISLNKIETVSGLTDDLYEHSLTVATSVLEANAGIIAMHRSMKDVALAQDAAGDRHRRAGGGRVGKAGIRRHGRRPGSLSGRQGTVRRNAEGDPRLAADTRGSDRSHEGRRPGNGCYDHQDQGRRTGQADRGADGCAGYGRQAPRRQLRGGSDGNWGHRPRPW